MKNLHLILWIAVMGLFITFSSCEKGFEVTSTHTDASALVGGTYSGTLSNGTTKYSDALVILTKIENDSVQAVTVGIQSTSFAKLNVEGKLNVGKANDEFILASGFSGTQKLCGHITGNTIVLNVPLSKSGSALSNASTAIVWAFEGLKK
jgi:hypothetical protein